MEKESVLVTGSSGFIGRVLLKRLSQLKIPTVALYHKRLVDGGDFVYPVCSDLSSPELLAAPLRFVKTVIHLGWEGGFKSSYKRDHDKKTSETVALKEESINLRMTYNLVKAMEKAQTPKLIFLSSAGAKNFSSTRFFEEKYEAESIILNSELKSAVIARAPIVCSGEMNSDRFIQACLRAMRYPGLLPIPFSSNHLSFLHLDELISYLTKLVTRDDAWSSDRITFSENITSETWKVEEVMKMIAQKYAQGHKLPIKGKAGSWLVQLSERKNMKEHTSLPSILEFLDFRQNLNVSLDNSGVLTQKKVEDIEGAPTQKESFEKDSYKLFELKDGKEDSLVSKEKDERN